MTTTDTAVERPSTVEETRSDPITSRRHPAGLALILLLAAFARFYRFPAVPGGLNQDEVSAGYETMSLLAAGTDRWGNRWPVYFTAFGSGQNVLQSYLNMPFLAVLGPTPLGLRLLPALLGVLTVGLAYALTTRLAGRRAGLVAALLLALCPWHVMMSRWSLESNMVPPFLLLAVWALVAAYQSPRRWPLPLSLAPMALVFYAYAAVLPVVVLFVVVFLACEFRVVRRRPVAVAASLGLFGLLSLPFGLFLLVNQVLHRVPGWLTGLPFGLQLLPGNRLDEISGDGLVENNLRFALGQFDDHIPWNVMEPYLPLGLIVVPMAAAGVCFALRDRGSRAYVPVLWLVSAAPMFLLAPLNVNRLNVIFLPLVVLAALGLDGVARAMSAPRAGKAVLTAVLSVGLLYNAVFVADYFTRYDDVVRVPFNVGLDEALAVADRQATPGEPVYVSQYVLLNYLYVLFYEKVDPRDFQANASYEIVDTRYRVRNYRDYHFRRDDPLLATVPSYLALFRSDEPHRCAGGATSKQKVLAHRGEFAVVRCTR